MAEETKAALVIDVASAVVGAVVGLGGPGAAVAGAALTPVLATALHGISDVIVSTRRERATETLTDAAEAAGAVTPDAFLRFVADTVADEQRQELLVRVLTVAQDTAMRDKRRALGRVLANAVAEKGTKVDDELAFVRVLADLDPVHVRILRIMSHRPPTWIALPRR
jgi:hypothetical protein